MHLFRIQKKISDDAIGALKEYEIKPALWSKKDSYISELIAYLTVQIPKE